MRAWVPAVLLAAGLAGCGAVPPPPDTARLPPGVFGTGDQDVPAVQYAAYAFADANRTYGNAVAGAQAVLAMDYIAGELNTSPLWASVPANTKDELLQARAAVRGAVGITPNAPSQLVVDDLNTARNELATGNTAAAAKALDNTAFTKGGAGTVALLANLPYIRIANVATTDANEALFSPTGGSEFQE